MRTLLILFLLWLPIVALAAVSSLPYIPPTVKVAWDANDEVNVAGYYLLAGTASRTYTLTNQIVGRMENTAILTNMPNGKVFVAVVAYTTDGTVSDFSNEVAWTNRPAPPRNLRVAATIQAAATQAGPWVDLARIEVPVPVSETQQVFRSQLLMFTNVDVSVKK